jgi:formamidopyrimidine-DNA glycosylase
MPELPEVEVTRRGVEPHLTGQIITDVIMRREGLRWPFPPDLAPRLRGQVVRATERRGKYLLLRFDTGTVLIHLGMSGHLRVLPVETAVGKHDHIDVVIGKLALRMNDPRRFGAVLWHDAADGDLLAHPLLTKLGVEPLEDQFNAELLYRETRSRTAPIKQVLLSGDIVVGVGNIYACESLFSAGISPKTAANRVSLARYRLLADAIRRTLAAAIVQGGSSLRDFIAVNGQSGYFQQNYFVYDRTGKPCRVCSGDIKQLKQGQRSTFYCATCQK